MDHLVVGSLQEGGINRHDGLQALAGQPGGKGDRVLLGDTHVKVAGGEAFFKLHHAGTFAHGGRDAHQTRVFRGHVAQPLAKHLRESLHRWRAGLLQAHRRVKLARAMVGDRVCLGQFVALPFFGDHVQELRTFEMFDVFQRGNQRIEVVAIDRADIVEAKFFEERGRNHHALGVLFNALGQFKQGWRAFEHRLAHVFRRRIKLTAHQLRQIPVKRAHWRADAHVVVVQYHQQIAVSHAGIVERLECHASRQCTVTNHRNGVPVFTLDLGRQGHAQRGRNGGAGVRRAKGVVFAFHPLRKPAQATQLAQRGHTVTPPGEDLVRVGLVAHIPHHTIVRRVEHVVQRNRQLHRAQVGAEVTAGFGYAVDQIGTQLRGKRAQLRTRQFAQISRGMNGFEQRIGSL